MILSRRVSSWFWASAVLADIQGRDDQWHGIQNLVNLDCKSLWMTSGTQFHVNNPNRAPIHGFTRVVRAENPSLVLLTLDIEAGSSANALKATRLAVPKTQVESAYAERSGIPSAGACGSILLSLEICSLDRKVAM